MFTHYKITTWQPHFIQLHLQKKLTLFFVRSTKLKGELQSILKLLDQFFLAKINFFKLPNCNMHFLKFISISTKENTYISICDHIMSIICQVRKTIVRNFISYFFHQSKRHLISFTSIWKLRKIYNSQLTSSLIGSFVSIVILKMSKL